MSLRTSDGPSSVLRTRNCHCFIKHAVTQHEIAAAGRRLEEARYLGDTNGIIIALTMLTSSCPAKEQR
tara:strand:- start:72 stop:275 length:204 start_codon:yes stop_codon:yes gene_type:complete